MKEGVQFFRVLREPFRVSPLTPVQLVQLAAWQIRTMRAPWIFETMPK